MPQSLSVGDQVSLTGGYDFEPAWLAGKPACLGVVTAFIPGQNQAPAAVVKLDAPITVEGCTGEVVVLERRYASAEWMETGTVHVELCDFTPEPKTRQHRRQGKWVESHASYKRLPSRAP
jgi:hypothetical protein